VQAAAERTPAAGQPIKKIKKKCWNHDRKQIDRNRTKRSGEKVITVYQVEGLHIYCTSMWKE
jgi:hypothetical protein